MRRCTNMHERIPTMRNNKLVRPRPGANIQTYLYAQNGVEQCNIEGRICVWLQRTWRNIILFPCQTPVYGSYLSVYLSFDERLSDCCNVPSILLRAYLAAVWGARYVRTFCTMCAGSGLVMLVAFVVRRCA